MKKLLSTVAVLMFIYGCSAIKVKPEARSIELVNDSPNKKKCRFLGEIVGSQGNWFTGDWTSNENLVVGARNELRNEASKLGANIVYIQDMKNTNAWNSKGTTNTTAIGKAYKCSN
jgi:nitrous oxide reductase accessory protein NosL